MGDDQRSLLFFLSPEWLFIMDRNQHSHARIGYGLSIQKVEVN